MRKDVLYLGLTFVLIMICVTFFFETNHPDNGLETPYMSGTTFADRTDGDTPESAAIAEARQSDDTVLQQSVQAAKTFGENIRHDLTGE